MGDNFFRVNFVEKKGNFMNISKLDSAKRQLDTAINLFFKESDPVSIHTLVAAAHQLLIDIGNLMGIKSLIKENSIINKKYFKDYIREVNKPENFFKHAKSDSGALINFNPEQTEFLLLDAVEMYMQIASEKPEDMNIFRMWFFVKYPNVLSSDIQKSITEKELNINMFKKKNKLEFYQDMKSVLMFSGSGVIPKN